jgi:hypothetical protein
MVHGVWCMVYGAWCMVCMVHSVWCIRCTAIASALLSPVRMISLYASSHYTHHLTGPVRMTRCNGRASQMTARRLVLMYSTCRIVQCMSV